MLGDGDFFFRCFLVFILFGFFIFRLLAWRRSRLLREGGKRKCQRTNYESDHGKSANHRRLPLKLPAVRRTASAHRMRPANARQSFPLPREVNYPVRLALEP